MNIQPFYLQLVLDSSFNTWECSTNPTNIKCIQKWNLSDHIAGKWSEWIGQFSTKDYNQSHGHPKHRWDRVRRNRRSRWHNVCFNNVRRRKNPTGETTTVCSVNNERTRLIGRRTVSSDGTANKCTDARIICYIVRLKEPRVISESFVIIVVPSLSNGVVASRSRMNMRPASLWDIKTDTC
jgi:hypothetical protein